MSKANFPEAMILSLIFNKDNSRHGLTFRAALRRDLKKMPPTLWRHDHGILDRALKAMEDD
jgi:hypothetical protein